MRIGSTQTPKVTTSDMSNRVKYPNRTVYFSVQTGLMDEKAYAEHVERERLRRVEFYLAGCLIATTIDEFKAEFNISC